MSKTIYFSESQLEKFKQRYKEIYQSFNEIQWIKNNIVNKELSHPLENQGINDFKQAQQAYRCRFNSYSKKINTPRAYIAKYWILPAIFFCMLLQELFKKETNLATPFIIAFGLTVFIVKYQKFFTDIPFQYRYAGSFFLKSEELIWSFRLTKQIV